MHPFPYSLILGSLWLVFLLVWFLSSFKTNRTTGGWQRGLVVRILMICLIVFIFDNNGAIFSFGTPAFFASPAAKMCGLILAAIGIGTAIWARAYLGRNWGMPMSLKENRELVTSGPYKYVRHPIYTGAILALFGSMLVNGPSWIVVFLLFFVYFAYSATQEEKQLAKEFPETYPEYKRRTKMLIPFIF